MKCYIEFNGSLAKHLKALIGKEDVMDSNHENGTACHSYLPTQLSIVSGSINESSGYMFQDIILRSSKLQVHTRSVSPRPALKSIH